MAFQLIHTVCEGDTKPQAGHRARCTEGWLCRQVCSWRGTCTVGQVASPLGIPCRGGGRGVRWRGTSTCHALFTGSRGHALDTRSSLRTLQTTAVFYATKRTWRVR